MLAAQQRFAVVFDGDGAAGELERDEQVDDAGPAGELDRVAVGRDGDQGYFFAAACLAAAFFSALKARTLPRLASSTMSATDRYVFGLP